MVIGGELGDAKAASADGLAAAEQEWKRGGLGSTRSRMIQRNVARFQLYRHRSLQVESFGFNFFCSGSPQNYPNP